MSEVEIIINARNAIQCKPDSITLEDDKQITFNGDALPAPFSLKFKNKKALEGKDPDVWHPSEPDKTFVGNVDGQFKWWHWPRKRRSYGVRVPSFDDLDPTIIIKRPPILEFRFWLIVIGVILGLAVGLKLAFG